jgi:hypothetical protein
MKLEKAIQNSLVQRFGAGIALLAIIWIIKGIASLF